MSRAEFVLLFILSAPLGVALTGFLHQRLEPVAFGLGLAVLCSPFLVAYVLGPEDRRNG